MRAPLHIPSRSRSTLVPEPPALCPHDCAACNTLHMPPGPSPQAPGSASGGKGPAKHPGFIVPQKEGTNYLPTLWSAQGKNRGQWGGEGGKWGAGGRGRGI